MWCVGELDGEYIARMEDVLALYEKPLSEEEPVVCVDEKPVVLHADLRPPRPMYPGRTLRRDSEYERRGTANAFCGVEPKAGRHYPRVTPDRSSPEFADYLLEIAEHYPAANTIHLVMDNLSSHTRKAVVERYGEKAGGWLWDRFTVHYTPKHGSAGSIRQRSKSACSPGSAWDGEESHRWAICGGKPGHGAGE
jgi:hypothetical protein